MKREVMILVAAIIGIIFLAQTVSAIEVTETDEYKVTWYPIQEGIIHYAYNISIENKGPIEKDSDIASVISETSFDASQLKNVIFYELTPVINTVEEPVYSEEIFYLRGNNRQLHRGKSV